MKKILYTLLILLLSPSIVLGATVQVNRLNTDHIEPLSPNDYIKSTYFNASSTVATSTFNGDFMFGSLFKTSYQFNPSMATWSDLAKSILYSSAPKAPNTDSGNGLDGGGFIFTTGNGGDSSDDAIGGSGGSFTVQLGIGGSSSQYGSDGNFKVLDSDGQGLLYSGQSLSVRGRLLNISANGINVFTNMNTFTAPNAATKSVVVQAYDDTTDVYPFMVGSQAIPGEFFGITGMGRTDWGARDTSSLVTRRSVGFITPSLPAMGASWRGRLDFSVKDSIASTTAITILSTGGNANVGIGTTSPYAKLSVDGQVVGAYFAATTTATSTLPNVNATTGLKATNYYSSDGTVGFTGTCTIVGLTSITVKNGLITSCQ